jgi:predicted CXXCH cytochrome family protein
VEALLRRIQQAPNGLVSAVDTAVNVDRVTIGSAAACTLQLLGRSVAAVHAYIGGADGAMRIRCARGNQVVINGKRRAAASLAVGDVIELAGHRLAVLTAPAGFDCAIEVKPSANIGANEYEGSFRTELSQTWLSARAISWVAVLLILTLSLLIPLHMIHRHREGLPSIAGLPDDTLWSSGPLTQAHAHAAGQRCDACHQQFFAHVQDGACRECHKDTNDHVSKAHRNLASLGDPQRCGACHREHVGEQARAVLENDGLCVQCHANADRQFAALNVKNVAGFEPGGAHPDFSVQLKRPPAGSMPSATDVAWVVYRVPLKEAIEQSNLKFSHAEHLNADKVTSDKGIPLGCSDCHTLNVGDRFIPITMTGSCSSCHQLNFDITAPDRQLPHGKPRDAMAVIEDYFNRKFTDPPPKVEVARIRPRPDIDPNAKLDVDPCEGPVIACARGHAKAEIENQFNPKGRGCAGCHVVEDTLNPDIHDRFHVTPVRLGSDYFPDLKFSHMTHRVQGKLSGDAACESCHGVRKSNESKDLLLPNVDKCLSCHRDFKGEGTVVSRTETAAVNGQEGVIKVVTLQCISCHVYHPTALLTADGGMKQE